MTTTAATAPNTAQHLRDLLAKLRYDTTAMQAKISDAFRELNRLEAVGALNREPAGYDCPRCGIHCKGPRTLAEHLYVSHNGPLPAHYAAIEAASVDGALQSEIQERAA